MLYPNIERLRQIVADEVRQRCEEGCPAEAFGPRVAAAGSPAELVALYEELAALRPAADFGYVEPSDLAAIRAARPPRRSVVRPPDAVDEGVARRIHGGWLGRCAGLVLGKPFECRPFTDQAGAVRRYLQAAGAYPLADYAPADAAACAAVGRAGLPWPECQRGQVRWVPPDDDIHYTIMGLEVLEQRGGGFTTADVAHWWTHRLPAAELFTAEEAAYRNLVLLGGQFEPQKLAPQELAQVRTWLNPYREWIGAQIRADGWALACPGDPERAAEFAWRDATLSHAGNGIYGEMLCAAMIAAALVCTEPRDVVAAGLEQIPQRSRLARAVERTAGRCAAVGYDAGRFEEVHDWLWQELGHYDPIHTINNAAAVVAAVLLGGRDFEKTITIAVLCGWDTDCNGATAGCIAGALLGAERLPRKWTAPLHDTLRVNVQGFNPAAISACARRHVAVARALRA